MRAARPRWITNGSRARCLNTLKRSMPRRTRSTAIRVKEAKRRLDEELWTEIRANEGYERYRAKGVDRRGGRLGSNTIPRPYTPPEVPQGQINTTDLDSRMVKGQHGWLQGYNAQAAINEQRIVIAAEIAVVSPDLGHLAPMVAAARAELAGAAITDAPKAVLADSGYWHTEQMHQLAADGIPVLIPPDSGLRTTPRPGWHGGYFSFMRNVLQTEHGAGLYKQRQHLIETLFGSIKHNRGIIRFHRRGRASVRTEWRLITATHNLLKLHNYRLAAG